MAIVEEIQKLTSEVKPEPTSETRVPSPPKLSVKEVKDMQEQAARMVKEIEAALRRNQEPESTEAVGIGEKPEESKKETAPKEKSQTEQTEPRVPASVELAGTENTLSVPNQAMQEYIAVVNVSGVPVEFQTKENAPVTAAHDKGKLVVTVPPNPTVDQFLQLAHQLHPQLISSPEYRTQTTQDLTELGGKLKKASYLMLRVNTDANQQLFTSESVQRLYNAGWEIEELLEQRTHEERTIEQIRNEAEEHPLTKQDEDEIFLDLLYGRGSAGTGTGRRQLSPYEKRYQRFTNRPQAEEEFQRWQRLHSGATRREWFEQVELLPHRNQIILRMARPINESLQEEGKATAATRTAAETKAREIIYKQYIDEYRELITRTPGGKKLTEENLPLAAQERNSQNRLEIVHEVFRLPNETDVQEDIPARAAEFLTLSYQAREAAQYDSQARALWEAGCAVKAGYEVKPLEELGFTVLRDLDLDGMHASLIAISNINGRHPQLYSVDPSDGVRRIINKDVIQTILKAYKENPNNIQLSLMRNGREHIVSSKDDVLISVYLQNAVAAGEVAKHLQGQPLQQVEDAVLTEAHRILPLNRSALELQHRLAGVTDPEARRLIKERYVIGATAVTSGPVQEVAEHARSMLQTAADRQGKTFDETSVSINDLSDDQIKNLDKSLDNAQKPESKYDPDRMITTQILAFPPGTSERVMVAYLKNWFTNELVRREEARRQAEEAEKQTVGDEVEKLRSSVRNAVRSGSSDAKYRALTEPEVNNMNLEDLIRTYDLRQINAELIQIRKKEFRTTGNLNQPVVIDSSGRQVTTQEELFNEFRDLLEKQWNEAETEARREAETHIQFFRINTADQAIIEEFGLIEFLKYKALDFAADSTWGKIPSGPFFTRFQAELEEAETFATKVVISEKKAKWPNGPLEEPQEYKRMQNDVINGAVISASLASGEIEEWQKSLLSARSMGIDGGYRLNNINGVEEIAQLEQVIAEQLRVQDGRFIATDDLNRVEDIVVDRMWEQAQAGIGEYANIYDEILKRILGLRFKGVQTRAQVRSEFANRLVAEPHRAIEVKEIFDREALGRARIGRWTNMIFGYEATIASKGIPVDKITGKQIWEISHRGYPKGVWQGYEVMYNFQLSDAQREFRDLTTLYIGRDKLNEWVTVKDSYGHKAPNRGDNWHPDSPYMRGTEWIWDPKKGEYVEKSRLQIFADTMRMHDLLMFEADSLTDSYRMYYEDLVPRPWLNELYERIVGHRPEKGHWEELPFAIGVQLRATYAHIVEQKGRSGIDVAREQREQQWRGNVAEFFPEWGMQFVYEIAPFKSPNNRDHPEDAREYRNFIDFWNSPEVGFLDQIAANRRDANARTQAETWSPRPGLALDPTVHNRNGRNMQPIDAAAFRRNIPDDQNRRILSEREEIAHRRYTYFMDNFGDLMNTYREIGYHHVTDPKNPKETPDPYQRNFAEAQNYNSHDPHRPVRGLTTEEDAQIDDFFRSVTNNAIGAGTADNFRNLMRQMRRTMGTSHIAEELSNNIIYIEKYRDMPSPDSLLHIDLYREPFTKALQSNGRDLESLDNSFVHQRLGGEAVMEGWVKGHWSKPEDMEEGVEKAAKEAEWWGLQPDYAMHWIRYWTLYCYALQTGSKNEIVLDAKGRLEMSKFYSFLNWVGYDPQTFWAEKKSLFAILTHELDFPDINAEQAHQLYYKNAHHMHATATHEALLRAQALLALDPKKIRLLKRSIFRILLLFFPIAIIRAFFGETQKIASEV